MPRSLLWPDPRVKPPFGAAEVDWGHSLARNLDALWLFNEAGGVARDWLRHFDMTPSGTAIEWRSSTVGLGLALNTGGATSSFYAFDQAVIAFAASEDFTIGFRYATTDTYGPLISLGNVATGGKIDLIFGYNGSDDSAGRLGGQFRDNAFAGQLYLMGTSTAFTNGATHSAMIRRSGSTISVLGDGGSEITSGTGTTAALTFATNMSALGAQRRWINDAQGNLTQQYLSVDYSIGVLARRAWPNDECLWFHAEPYAMLRPIVRRRYFVPVTVAAAGAHGAMYPRMQRHIHQSWTVPRVG